MTPSPVPLARGPDSEPRPSRPIPGRDTGLELEVIEETPAASGKGTSTFGTVDELEFDPTSVPPPPLPLGERSHAVSFGGSPDAFELDLSQPAPAPKTPSERPASSRSSRPPRMDASASNAAPALDIPALDIPSLTPARGPAKAPPQAQPAAARSPSVRPAPPSVDVAAFPGLGNEVDLGEGLDDLDFGGAAAAQLNVGIPTREPDDDVPWPSGRTPEGPELALDHREAVELSGFGPAPDGFLQTPVYALRVFRALEDLRKRVAQAEKQLHDAEDRRDERLAALALEKRAELEKKDRFSDLYSQIERHDDSIALKKRQLEMADVEGAQALRDVQAQIDTLNVERLGREKTFEEQRVILDAAALSVKRLQAGLQRVQIEWRNIEARAAKVPGKAMPEHLDAQLDVLETQRAQIIGDLNSAQGQFKEVKKSFDLAENHVRIALAEVRRAEGQKEGLLMAYEGDIAERSRALDRALFEKQQELARVARAIMDLRGEVPVAGSTRSQLLALDREVLEAARHFETMKMALDSMDQDAYATGRAVWIAGTIVVLLVLVFLLL